MAPPAKRKRKDPDQPSSGRKSARLADRPKESTESAPVQPRGLSRLATTSEPPDTQATLAERARARIAAYQPLEKDKEELLKPSLNALIDWLPEKGWESIARDILEAKSDEALYAVFHNVLTALAAPMKARSRPPTVTPSPLLKREQNVEAVAATLDTPQTRQRSFRDKCFERDRYRCVVTGNTDTSHWNELGRPNDMRHGQLEAAHIIPFAYASWDKSSGPPEHIARAWEALYRCFPRIRQIGMEYDDINALSNGISLRYDIHPQFGEFAIAFKPTDTENVYELKVFPSYPTDLRPTLPEGLVKFTRAEDAQDLELPSAALLDCHYRLAEILNASGMGEAVEQYQKEWERLKESADGSLRHDGGTDLGRIIRTALWTHVAG
ncbi:hypothetical protein FQN50_005631 [Emmonsiellopsis sp. PD_5]|nr:hypothetical protein FQN50_005631 [Emmonsiellopsis sp. PD_5]